MDNTSNMKSKLLPIHIVKRDSDNTKTLSRKKVNFQINFGKNYNINYKYFMPEGYHLASNSKADVSCEYNANGLTVPSITFTYVKDGGSDLSSSSSAKRAEPVRVTYVDVDSRHHVKTGIATGHIDQRVNVLKQVPVPSGYHLRDNQKIMFKLGTDGQSVDLLIKHDPVKQSGKIINDDDDQVAPHSSHAGGNLSVSIKKLERNLQDYNYSLAIQLIRGVMERNLSFFKKVITRLFANLKYKDVNNLALTSGDRKVSGVIKKYLYNNNQVNFTFVRAKRCPASDEITVSEVRDFVTSVMDHNCSKGIFITTSDFSSEAKKEAERHSIILVNDMHLAKLMINHNVGVKPKRIFKVVDLDRDFFD